MTKKWSDGLRLVQYFHHAVFLKFMSQRRDTRRLAMQLLYQFDQRGVADAESILAGLDDGGDGAEVCQAAFALAMAAWEGHGDADRIATCLAPDWPTHRQPPVDRAIIRLAHHEMVTDHVPVGVAINEAVELAKHYGAEHSSAFVNGVLDKMARQMVQESREALAHKNKTSENLQSHRAQEQERSHSEKQ